MSIFDFFCKIFGSLPFIGKICHDDRSSRANKLFDMVSKNNNNKHSPKDFFGGSRRTRITRRNRRTRRK
jgi:hypothetical protein